MSICLDGAGERASLLLFAFRRGAFTPALYRRVSWLTTTPAAGPLASNGGISEGFALFRHDHLRPAQHKVRLRAGIAPLALFGDQQGTHPFGALAADALVQARIVGRADDRVVRLHAVAQKRGVPPAQVALAWLLTRSPVMLPIPGTSSRLHLEENIAAAGVLFNEEEMMALERSVSQ